MKQTLRNLGISVCLGLMSTAVAADGAGDVSATDLRARAVPEGQKNSAAFMTLSNSGSGDHAVVAAQSPVANIVELHTHIDEGGMMKMRRIDKIEVGAGSDTILQPGGLHVMLIGLKQQLNDGDDVPVTLEFEDGSRLELVVPAKKMQMKMMKEHSHGTSG